MNVQFHHKRNKKLTSFEFDTFKGVSVELLSKGGTTIALQVPTIEEFNDFKPTGSKLDLNMGLAKCSDLDNYNKKIGRSIALGRIYPVLCDIIKNNEDEVILNPIDNKFPSMILKRSPEGNRVHFVGLVK
jgi:hypothetical protein